MIFLHLNSGILSFLVYKIILLFDILFVNVRHCFLQSMFQVYKNKVNNILVIGAELGVEQYHTSLSS